MQEKIFSQMLTTRERKYKYFLKALKAFKYLSMSPTRGNFLESYYALMRHIDDVVDGDAPMSKDFQTSAEFVKRKIDFARNPKGPKDDIDSLMLHCFKLAEKFQQSFFNETQDILSSMLFDAKRHGKEIIFPKKELSHHFHTLDIRGTVVATLKVFKEDSSKYSLLEPLGTACRIHYNLRDYDEDINIGLINISAEDCKRFEINRSDIKNKKSKGVKSWFEDQSRLGLHLLEKHRSLLPTGNFNLLTRATLKTVYENPAKKFLEKSI